MKKTAIDMKHPAWNFRELKNGSIVGIMKEEFYEELISIQFGIYQTADIKDCWNCNKCMTLREHNTKCVKTLQTKK